MDKKEWNQAIEQINVPKDKVFHAMDRGMKRASELKANDHPTKKKIVISTVAAAALLGTTIASGFFNPAMNKVLAKAPFIGQLYQEFGDTMGTNLAKQNLVTNLNQSLAKNGVVVEITSAYFDGNVVSITGHVAGDLDNGGNEKGEVSFDVNFENYKGDNDPWLNMSKGIRKKGDGYDFHWKLNYPYKTIHENLSLPISIHNINGIKGEWNFIIPITQEKFRQVTFDNQIKAYADKGVKIGIKEIKVAQASSFLEFETVSEYKEDLIEIDKAVDNRGKTLFSDPNSSILSEAHKNDGYHKILRKTFDKIDPTVTSITFYPYMSIAAPIVEQGLDKESFTLNSKRTNMAIKVNNVKQVGDKLVLDYQFLGYADKLTKNKLDLLTYNLSYEFRLIDKNYLDKIDPANPVPPDNHSISRNKVTLLDEKTAHFQSIFDLNGEEKIENYKLENTVLQFNFSSFIGTEKLEPFTVEIPSRK